MISEETYGLLLDQICEAALEPAAWDQVLRRLASLTGSIAGGITVENPETGQGRPLTFFGFDPDHVQKTFDYYLPQNPLFAIKDRMLAGSIVTNSMAVSLEDFRSSEFYHGWAKPQDICCPVTVVLHRDAETYVPLTLARPDGAGDASEDDCALLTRVAPHLTRALLTGMQLARLNTRSGALGSALSQLGAAVFLLNDHGQISFANMSAEQMLSSGDVVVAGRDRILAAVERRSYAALRTAIAGVLRGGASADVSLRQGIGRPVGATVLSVPGELSSSFPITAGATCVVIIGTQDDGRPVSAARQMARLYTLTPAEERVLVCLLTGQGLAQVADSLHIRRSTAQTHLKSIFVKTGTRRQGELIQLALRSTLPNS